MHSFGCFLISGLSVCFLLNSVFAENSLTEKKEARVVSLTEAQKRVLATDQSIRNAYLEIQKAKLLPWSALTKYGPRITGSTSYSNGPSSALGGGSDRTDTKNAAITYQQPLLDPTFFPAYRFGKLSTEVSQLEKQFLERDVILGLIAAYYDVLKQKKLVQLDHQILGLTEKQLEFAQERLHVGDLSSLDVLRAQLDVENAKSQLIADESNLVLSKNTLRSILNFDERQDFEVEEPPVEKIRDEDFETALQRAYRQREDYTNAALAIEQGQEQKNQIIAEYAPTINGQLRQQWTETSGRESSPWDASITLQMLFFEGGQREVDLKNADYAIEQSHLARETLAKSIQVEVKDAWVQVRTLRQRLRDLSVAAETAEQAHLQTQAQYEVGASSSLDVLVSLRDFSQAKTNFITAQYDYLVALKTLERATADLGRQKEEQKNSS